MVLNLRRTEMARKRNKPEEIVAKLRQVDALTVQGMPVSDAIRSIDVTEVTYYRWRQEYGAKSDFSTNSALGPLSGGRPSPPSFCRAQGPTVLSTCDFFNELHS
jgi:hypothetical protein